MSRILCFTSGPESWRPLLANPDKGWKREYSARTLAYSWEEADGFPPEIDEAFRQTREPRLADLTPVLAIPEFKVPLPGGQRASQNDVFVLGQSKARPVTIMVEGKVNESFGQTLGQWRRNASPGKRTRLKFLTQTLGLAEPPPSAIRYQLLHRAASAIITGEQYRAVAAVLLVHSFSEERVGWTDYQAFTRLFGVDPVVGVIQRLPSASTIPLFGVWITGDPAFLKR